MYIMIIMICIMIIIIIIIIIVMVIITNRRSGCRCNGFIVYTCCYSNNTYSNILQTIND